MSKNRPALWKRILRFCLFGVIALVTLVALGLSWISFQARRDWAKTKADLLARGEKLSLVEFTPPPIPNDQNFFGDPMWQELTDTVDSIGDFGQPLQEPRVPKGKRLIDAIDPVLPTPLMERSKIVFSAERFSQVVPSSCWETAKNSLKKLKKTTDPTARRELAEFALECLAPGLPARQHIEVLLNRPKAQITQGYSDELPSAFPTLTYILRVAQTFNSSALAHLALGDAPAAAREALATIRLSQTLKAEPLIICQLMRVAVLGMATGTISQGIEAHQWADAELAAFEEQLAPIDLSHELVHTFRTERGYGNQVIQSVLQNGPTAKGFFDQAFQAMKILDSSSSFSPLEKAGISAYLRFGIQTDQASYNRFVQQYIDVLNTAQHVDPRNLPTIHDREKFPRFTEILTSVANSFHNIAMQTAYRQDDLLQTRMACALERYRLEHGTYPDSLEAIVPKFLPTIPDDVIAGQKFHYARESADKFRLWSAGWNQIDEHGKVGTRRNHYEESDWVWNSSDTN